MKNKPQKFDTGKSRVDLLPTEVLLAVGHVFRYGAEKKYDDFNYAKGTGLKWRQPMASALRHIFEWSNGREKDPETGMHPLDHAIAELMILSHLIKLGKTQGDNRFV